MKMYTLSAIISILLIFTSGLFAQTTIVLPAIKDNSMFSESGSKSLGAGKLFTGQNCQGNNRRALIEFDLSGIPAEAIVTEVTLRLGAESSGANGVGVIEIFAMTKDWGEGFSSGSGNGGPAVAPDATWTDAMFGTSTWDTPGGDFDPVVLTSRFTDENNETITFPSTGNFVAKAQTWLDNANNNHGILVRGVEDQPCAAYRFGARDIGTMPELVVTLAADCEPLFTNLFIEACDSYTFPGGSTYNMSGTYNEVVPGPNNCDSIFNIDLLIFETDELIINETLCPEGSVTVNGTIYDANNPQGVELLVGFNGCDSIVTVDLDFYPLSIGSISYDGCEGDGFSVVVNGITYDENNRNGMEILLAVDQYGCDSIVSVDLDFALSDTTYLLGTSCNPNDTGVFEFLFTNMNGCDSLVTTEISLLTSTIETIVLTTCNPADAGVVVDNFMNVSGCDSVITTITTLLPNDTTYLFETSCNPIDTGVFEFLFTNMNGCDSLVTTETGLQLLDNSVVETIDGGFPTLTAVLEGASYQWIDCDYNTPIPGETGPSYTLMTGGDFNFAVIITQDECSVTSDCFNLTLTGTEDVWFYDQIAVLPNPTPGDLRLTFGDLDKVNIRLVDLTGRVLLEKNNISGGSEDLRIEGAAGLYFVGVEVDGLTGWVKVVKGN